jgi:hypothetical protein
MLPPQIADQLNALGHDAISPWTLGTPTLPDAAVIERAISEGRVIVTEDMGDFAGVTRCSAVFVRKSWWPPEVLAPRLTTALSRWAEANPEPGFWARWLDAEFR